ncbi:MAG TPA: T9SS type A sorting domain-containing protein [Chitinophagales bacterium]|nr:T9SS type A sorting domain-containing protein [Chitinophagales bacterium]
MTKALFTLIFYIAVGYVTANNRHTNDALFQKLAYVNAEWNNQPEAKQLTGATQITGNTTYNQWIATHLMLVEQNLRNRDVSSLSAQQKQNRANLLNELHGYWQAGVFPINNYLSYKNPVFIDRGGTHCAVGYLMMQSGHDDLAQAINRNEKFAYVHQIKTGGVKEWADAYGFTIDELAWIQPSYMPTTKFTELGIGPNGPVDFLLSQPYHLNFAGHFDSVNNLPCLNIGRYANGQMDCLGNGVDGNITGISQRNGQVAVTGSLLYAGQIYPAAYYNGTWNYLNIPGREGAFGQCGISGFGNYLYEVAISHPLALDGQELWKQNGNNSWQLTATIHGILKDIKVDDRYQAYVGSFDSITLYNALDTFTIQAHNFILRDRYLDQWLTAGTEVSDTILVAKVMGKTVYLGGVCSDDSGKSNICLTRYLNGVLQPLVFYYPYFPLYNNRHAISALEEYDNNLLLGGEFKYDGSVACKSLALLDVISGYSTSFAFLDSSVNALATFNGEIYLGGNFSRWSYQKPMRYIGKVSLPTGLSDFNGNTPLQLYPNPTQSTITFSTGDNGKLLQTVVSDLTGREVIRQSGIEVSNSISVEHLPPGIYILKALTQNSTGSARFVKN